MDKQISNIISTAHMHLRNIGRLRNYLSADATSKLVLSLVMSRVDYCNSLLTNVNKDQLRHLQALQNTAARIITKSKVSDHITPILNDLHWLPITGRIDYKTIVMAYKCLNNGMAPDYLAAELLPLYQPSAH
ncbi:uncharacterized protein LOC124263728 [Haliotis rubra]|uniref:uncharacterized protein LOC124263728 n=1 Tax=Haliotis rubra TaxID=36100 RepID=UPI001EE54937|nr:uncharacterized protein LOC124263728 [Haliotis rubra]